MVHSFLSSCFSSLLTLLYARATLKAEGEISFAHVLNSPITRAQKGCSIVRALTCFSKLQCLRIIHVRTLGQLCVVIQEPHLLEQCPPLCGQ